LQKIERYDERSGRKMNEYSMRMAMVPDTAEVIENPVGASPALRFDTPDEQAVFALPGVPYEMVHLLDQEVMPYLRAHFVKRHVRSQIFRLVGIPESNLSKLLSDLEEELPPEIRLAYNPGMGLIDLRLYLECELNRQRAFDQRFEASAQQLEELIAEYHYGYKDDTLESVLGQILRERKLTLATAESCTGGALAARLISVSGASDYMRGGVVAYSNTLKMDLLGVQAEGLEFNGAVSERVALQMAEGARKHLGADIGISSTGIAGPEGGTDSKPVGTVWLGIADGQETWARCFHFGRDRQQNIERSVITALHQLWRRLRHQKLEAPA
jgi:nicotinamide-nucleotide amidase